MQLLLIPQTAQRGFHVLLSRNQNMTSLMWSSSAWLCRPGWTKAPIPTLGRGGSCTGQPLSCPRDTRCLCPRGSSLLPAEPHRKPCSIYSFPLRASCTNSGKNLHSVKNNHRAHRAALGAGVGGDVLSTALDPQVLGRRLQDHVYHPDEESFPGLFLVFPAADSSLASFHLWLPPSHPSSSLFHLPCPFFL